MKPSQTEDKELLSLCLAGDREASEIFVQRFSSLVYWAVQNILVIKHIRFTEDDLHDLHNNVFLQLFEKQYKKLRQYRGDKGCSSCNLDSDAYGTNHTESSQEKRS